MDCRFAFYLGDDEFSFSGYQALFHTKCSIAGCTRRAGETPFTATVLRFCNHFARLLSAIDMRHKQACSANIKY